MGKSLEDPSTDESDDLLDPVNDDADDPLFGNFENNKDLELLLSSRNTRSKASTSRSNNQEGKNDVLGVQNECKRKRKSDILEELHIQMGNSLDKELGFSINKKLRNPAEGLNESTQFKHLLEEVERGREIEAILEADARTEENQKCINNQIQDWISNNVSNHFLNKESDNLELHSKWVATLKRSLKKIVLENHNVFDFDMINKKILEYPQYCPFKCFTNPGISGRRISGVDYILRCNDLNGYLASLDKQYIENVPLHEPMINIEHNKEDLKEILNKLGFDFALVTSQNQEICRKFDNKETLPLSGCGLQVLKFVKLVEAENVFSSLPIEMLIKILMLMSLDYNVNRDLQRFHFRNNRYTGEELCIIKIKELKQEIVKINCILKSSFIDNCPKLWYNFINKIKVDNTHEEKIFKIKLILKFILENEIDALQVSERFESIDDLEELFGIFVDYLENVISVPFLNDCTRILDIVYMKIELIKCLLLINDNMIRKWKTESKKRYQTLLKCVQNLKHHYFDEYSKSVNPLIPKCKRILDFIYHEVSEIDVGDFFVSQR